MEIFSLGWFDSICTFGVFLFPFPLDLVQELLYYGGVSCFLWISVSLMCTFYVIYALRILYSIRCDENMRYV